MSAPTKVPDGPITPDNNYYNCRPLGLAGERVEGQLSRMLHLDRIELRKMFDGLERVDNGPAGRAHQCLPPAPAPSISKGH